MIKATYKKYNLNFKTPSGTSRGILKIKETWFFILKDNGRVGIGETGLFRGLSIDDVDHYENKLKWVCNHIDLGLELLRKQLYEFPSIQFGLEQAFLSLKSESSFELFPSSFTRGKKSIPINGLIWMGNKSFMKNQIQEINTEDIKGYERLVNFTKKIFDKGFTELADVPFDKPFVMMQQLPALLKLKS